MSVGLGVWYAIWALGADLTGSSTASLALLFYPIMAQGWAWVAALVIVMLVSRLGDETK
jgi:drug/metabolite transporter (DMT)-like permease